MGRTLIATIIAGGLTLAAGPAVAQEDQVVEPDRGTVFVEAWEFRGGDDDGVAEPGERLEVFVTLRNGSDRALTDVAAALRSENDHVRVVSGQATWPDLRVREAAVNTTAFEIEVDEDAPRQEECAPMVIDAEPVPADEPVSSDGTVSSGSVSSDGSVVHDVDEPIDADSDRAGTVEPAQGSEPGTTGGGSAGSTGAEPAAEEPRTLPAEDPPAPEETEKTEETEEQPAPEPMPVEEERRIDQIESREFDPGVHVSLALAVTSSAGEDEVWVDTGIVCAFSDGEATADDRSFEALPISAPADGARGSRTASIASASVLLAAMAAILAGMAIRRRKLLA